jgi:flagellar biosynthetic protein FliS
MHAIASYRANRVDTASPLHVIVMLYQELLRRIELAAKAVEGDASADATAHLHRAREILLELLASLRAEEGNEALVANLDRLYRWSAAELVAVGRDRDAGRARRVARALMPLLEGWSALMYGSGR